MCMMELCKGTFFFFLSLHKIISYLSLILRKLLDHEVIVARAFT